MYRLKNLNISNKNLDSIFGKLHNLEDVFSHLSDNQLKSLVGLAGLLGFVALADDQILCLDEEAQIHNIICNVFNIKDTDTKKIIIFLKVLIPYLKENGDDYFSNLIKDSCNNAQREAVIAFLFRVAKANNSTTPAQLNSINEISKILDIKA